MDLEDVMLNKINQRKINTIYSFLCEIYIYIYIYIYTHIYIYMYIYIKPKPKTKLIDTENKLVCPLPEVFRG